MERDVTEFKARSDHSIRGKTDEDPQARLPPFVEAVIASLVPPNELVGGKPLAVIGEPDEAARHLAGVMLEEVGYRVLEASDEKAATALIEEHAGAVTLALLDERLPARYGQEWAQQAQESGSVVVSASSRRGGRTCRVRRLRKPWLPLELLREAERAFSR